MMFLSFATTPTGIMDEVAYVADEVVVVFVDGEVVDRFLA